MSKMDFKLDINGLRELMKSEEMQEVLSEAGESVANIASNMSDGEPYGVRPHVASYVAIANVYPASEAAAKMNSDMNIAVKALSSSGLPLGEALTLSGLPLEKPK